MFVIMPTWLRSIGYGFGSNRQNQSIGGIILVATGVVVAYCGVATTLPHALMEYFFSGVLVITRKENHVREVNQMEVMD